MSADDVRQASWVRRVSDDGIKRICGDLAYERGQGYVDAERVESISTGDQGRLLLASVEGSRARPYSTMVTALGSDTDGEPAWTGRCSCPVQTTCKHVAAVVLTAREHLVEEDGATQATPWQRQLDDALGVAKRSGRRASNDAQEPQSGALAVGLVQDRRGRIVDIEVRPTRPTKAGTWHRAMGWGQIISPQGASGLHRRQVTALRALHRSTSRSYWTHTSHPLLLSEVAPEFWMLLRRVLDEGVELVPDPAHPTPVSTSVRAEPVWCGVVLDENDDGSVQVRASTPDLPADATPIALGSPPSAVAWVEGTQLAIAPCEDEIDPLTASLLGRRPISVPADEVVDFVDTYLPRLERSTTVRRPGEGTGALPAEVEPIRLHLQVTGLDEGGVQVDQHLAYGDEQMPVDLSHAFVGRRRLEEQALVERLVPELSPLGLMEQVGGLSWWPIERVSLDGLAAVRFVEMVEALARHADLVIERLGELPVFEEITADPQIAVGTHEPDAPDGTDWFDLHVAVSIDGEEVPFEPLFQALVRGDGHMVLASGSYFRLDHPSLHRLRDLIVEAREMQDRPGEGTKVNRFQVGLWEELVALGVVGEQASTWQESVDRLRGLDTFAPPDLPEGLQATLRPYQQDGYAWLSTLWDAQLGGILADDMGLGKTVQVLAMLERARAAGDLTQPVLVVAPTSMVGVWMSEAARFAPELRVAQVTETSTKRGAALENVVAGADVVVTTYTVLRIDAEAFQTLPWRGLVLDEAQAVKNHQSKTYQAVRRVRAPFRLAMSGTPLENSLMDLWALLSVTAPGLYPKPEEFTTRYRRPIESGKAPELLAQLQRRIRPLMMRRTKHEVAADLPEKQIQVANIAMTPVHARIYEQHLQRERQRVLGLLDDPDGNQIAILAALTRLRQLALDPALVDDSYDNVTPSAKLSTLVEHVEELAAEGHRALVFSQFTRYLKRAESALAQADIGTCYLDGTMSAKQRAAEVTAFRAGSAPAFLISLKAGGTGLTLTEADYVFVLDPWWNPATEAQAIDRTHRIGQDKPVMVYRLVSQGTIEEKVVALQQRKRDLFDQVLGDGGALSGAITPEDVKGLLDL